MQWNKSYSIGVEKIDDQHKRLIQLATQLEDTLASDSALKTMGKTLKSLVDYTNYHFKDEEDLMTQINFSEYNEHKELHKGLIDEVRGILLDIRSGKPISVVDLIGFLKKWIIDHIQKEDKKIGLEMEKLREALIEPDGKTNNIIKSPTHELKGNLQKLKSFVSQNLITKEDFDAKKTELLDKFVRKFSPKTVVEVIEEFNSFHSLKEDGLINEDDKKRIAPELSKKLDLSVILSNDESLEDSLAHLSSIFEKKIIPKEVYDTFKKKILKQID